VLQSRGKLWQQELQWWNSLATIVCIPSFMSFFSIMRHSHVLKGCGILAGAFCALGSLTGVAEAQVGTAQSVNFGQALVSNSCALSTSDGSIGVRTNRNLITSDQSEGGNYTGALVPATISVSSNLGSTGFVKVENPTLSGGTSAAASQVKLGSTGAWGSSAQALLGADGSMTAMPLHVKFTSSGRFATGTYTASAAVSCYDGV
jgi:hypothetical protein